MRPTITSKKKVKRFLTIVLAIAMISSMVFTLCGCAGNSGTSNKESTEVKSHTEAGTGDLADSLPGYKEFDVDSFTKACDELEALVEAEDSEGVITKYEELRDLLEQLEEAYAISEIRYAQDTTDEYWDEQNLKNESDYIDCEDRLLTCMYQATQNGCAGTLKEYFTEEEYSFLEEYEPMTDEQKKLEDKEAELVNEYTELSSNDIYDVSYIYKGKAYTLETLDQAYEDVGIRDYDAYLEIYDGVMKGINDLLGPIYLELVQVRVQIAESYGYDNYSDYAYEEIYCRDYTPVDVQIYCDAIKEYVAPVVNGELIYCYAENDEEAYDREEIFENMHTVLNDADERLVEIFDHFEDAGYYTVATNDSMAGEAFTTKIPVVDEPYMFINTSGYGFATMTHEFGHYVDFYSQKTRANEYLYAINIDIKESQSNGLQLLLTNYYDEIYKDPEAMKAAVLKDILDQTCSGCIEDEFQRRVYDDPDMTLDEMNRLYCEICREYSQYEPVDYEYTWVLIPHTYESPLYYISYSVSTLAALDLYNISGGDLDAAFEKYFEIVAYDDENDGLISMEDELGLTRMTDSAGIKKIVLAAAEEALEIFE